MTRAAPEPPACLYVGRTAHRRLAPFARGFVYRVASLLIDVDRLDEASRESALFSVDRFNLFAFHRRDHGARDGSSLRSWAQDAFARAGVRLDGGAVKLYCFPRVLGYVFNPLSVWFGYGPDGALRGVIYAVNNTFGDRHAYVAPARGDGDAERHDAEKIFFVSPFFPARGRYAFRLAPPEESFALSIRYSVDGADQLVATQTGRRRPLNAKTLAGLFFSMPAMTLKVIAGIHWEALFIWRRGARLHDRPEPPAALSVAQACETGPAPPAAPSC